MESGHWLRHLSLETLRRLAAELARAPQTPEVASLRRHAEALRTGGTGDERWVPAGRACHLSGHT